MSKKTSSKIFAIVLILGMLFTATAPIRTIAQSTEPQGSVTVDPQVYQEIEADGSTSYWIEFKDKPDLSKATTMNWSERGWFVYEQLSKTADASQKNVVNYLNDSNVKFKSYWIKNTILVESSGINVLNDLLSYPEIEAIQPRKEYILYEPDKSAAVQDNGLNAIESNITHVNADDVWAMGYTGEGLVVANVDTGVRYSHEALVEEYRGNNGGSFDHNYNWFNPIDLTDDVPRDGNGHGTHTMGTMVGDDGGSNQIGIAPDAEWIACAGCPDGLCPDEALLGCGQWIAAPTDLAGENPDPNMRPNVVNNSWGDCLQEYDPWYADVIDGWHAAGVYPVFSNGNASNCGYSNPPGLNTVGNPARSGNVSGVGASGTDNGQYATFSNWGPTDNLDTINPTDGFDMMKPQVIAPGTSIRSSTPGSDTEYQDGWSGTSMAAPHVTGLVALIWQAAPCLIGDYAATENLIESTAVDIIYDDGCEDTPTDFPNFASGWGEIDALAAVEAAAGLCGDSTLQGTVTDSVTSEPLSGAKLEIFGTDPENDRVVYTNESGYYTAAVYGDTYDITVSKFGYTSKTETAVVVASEATVTQDFALDELDTTLVSGTVFDGGIEGGVSHGYSLYASLVFSASGFSETIYNDPFTGEYEIELYLGQEYSVNVAAVPMGYETLVENFIPDTNPETKDYTLYMPDGTCSAPGYEPDYDFFWNFEEDDGGFVTGGTTSFAWGDFTSGPGEGHSGTKGWATNLAGNYNASEEGWIESPVIDLSGYGTDTPAIQWWDWKDIESATFDWARLDVTKDGGSTWDTVWGPVGGVTDTDFNQQTVALDPSYNVADFQFRFYFKSDGSYQYAGWYIDDVGIVELPIPAPTEVFATDFDTDDGGFTVSGTSPSWEWGVPTTGSEEAYSDPNVWATNLAGNYNSSEQSYLTSPVIDLSAYTGLAPTISFMHWMDSESNTWDWGAVEITNDGGATWDTAWEKFGDVLTWTPKSLQLDPSYAVSNFQFRFYFNSDTTGQYPGWFIDDVAVTVAEPVIIAPDCVKIPGGVVAGFVYDDNTMDPIIGADVVSPDVATQTLENSCDPPNEGLYWVFQPVEDGAGTTTQSSVNSLAGSNVTFDPVPGDNAYEPGVEGTLCFISETFTNDYEYAYNNWLKFPDGWVVSDVVVEGTPTCDTGSFGAFAWLPGSSPAEVNIDQTRNQASTDHCVATYCVTVTPVDSGDSALVSWFFDGDAWGSVPHNPCSSDGYAPDTFTCDEAINPPASIPKALPIGQVLFTASKENYGSDSAVVDVVNDAVTQQDFTLGTGELTFDPTSFEVTMGLDDPPHDETLTISNIGSADADFELFEVDKGFTPLTLYKGIGVKRQAVAADEIVLAASNTSKETKPNLTSSMLNADVELILDDGTAENAVGIGGTSEFIFLNRFTPEASKFPFTLNEIQVYFDDNVTAGDEIVLAVYQNTMGNENPGAGAELLASIPTTVQAATSWNNYTIPGGVLFSGPGDVLIGVVAMETPGTDYFPAAIDETATQGRSWAGWWSSSPPPAGLELPPDENWGLIDSFGLPGNWMIRGMGSAGGGDVVWLSEDPVSGTVPSEGSMDVTLTFDPSTLEQPGDYEAELLTQHNTPYTYENIPVTLHVTMPDTWGTLKGTIFGLEACDVNPAPLADATVNIYNDLGTLLTSLTTDADGSYRWSLEAGTYDIEAVMDGYESIWAEDVVVAAMTEVVTDLELRLLAPCLSVDPESLEQWLGPDQTATQALSLINTGAGEGDFEILESEAITTETLLSEGFEGGVMPPAGGWETLHNGDTTREWTLVDSVTYPDFVYDGDYSAWINYDSSAESDEWLISPLLDVSEKTDLELTFMAISDTSYPGATMKLWVTDEVGTPLTAEPLWDMVRDETWSTFEYRQVSVDLSSFDEYGNIRVAWQYVGLDGDSFGLDLIEVSGSISLFSMLKTPLKGKVPSYSYNPEKDLPGSDKSKIVQNPGIAGEYVPMDTMIDESFEDAFPPDGWTQEINNAYTWVLADYDPHSGSYYAHVEYDPALNEQDEWLLTPEMNLSEGTLSVWSLGSIYWCRDTYDNCDGNVWLVIGDVGGGDDIFVKNLDEDWVDNWLWAESTIDLAPYLPGTSFRIGFQYLGSDGAEVAIDDVILDGVAGEAFDIPWLSEDPVLGTVPADSSLDVDVIFDSTGLAFGDYYGMLKVKSDQPDINVPVALHVIPAPEAFDQSLTTPEDVPLDITLEAIDPESDPLTYMIVDGPSHGTLEYEPGELPELTYVPDEDYYGMDSFIFKANDGVVDSNIATITIEVTSVNFQPKAVDDYYRGDENTDLVVPAPGVLENDSDDDPLDTLVADLLEEPEHGVVVLNEDGSFTYTPDTDFLGEDSFTYNLLGLPPEITGEYVDSATVYITVNTMPVAYGQNLSTDEDVPLDITLTADYLTPGPVVWTILTPPEHGTLSGTAPNLVYTPDLNWYGTDSFNFSVNDGEYESNQALVTIEVKPVNDEPQATDDYYEVDQDDILIVDAPGVLDNDSDVDPTDVFNAEFKTNPQHGYLELNPDGSFKYIPEPGFFGIDSFEYYMLSTPALASELSDWATVYITVHPMAKIFLPLLMMK